MKQFFIGVDGGATKCIVRVEDEAGNLLGREICGPANIRISVEQTWQSINSALDRILCRLGISLNDKYCRWHAGMGLAGCEIREAYEAFLAQHHHFETLVISSDAHTACLGAHAGNDGAIIIVGTGTVGFQVESGQTTKVGGWGFPHDDQGGGAWLGLEAVKLTLQALDGRKPPSCLTAAIYAKFSDNLDCFVAWVNQANSTALAELAPIVIQHSQAHDPYATGLLQEAALAVDRISDALYSAQFNHSQSLSCSLIGGIAPFIKQFLGAKLVARMYPCQLTPDAGAVLLVRNYLVNGDDVYNYSHVEATHD